MGQVSVAARATETSRRVKTLPRLEKKVRGDDRTRAQRFERGAERERKSDGKMIGELIVFIKNSNSHEWEYKCVETINGLVERLTSMGKRVTS